MTSRDAFFNVIKDTTVVIHPPKSKEASSTSILYNKSSVIIGCGRDGCEECGPHRELAIQNGGRFMDVRTSGATETFYPGNKLIVTRTQRQGLHPQMNKLDPGFCKRGLCPQCSSVNFARLLLEKDARHELFPTFEDLEQSTDSCPLCALVASVLVDPFSYHPDNSRAITLTSDKLGSAVGVSFPSIEQKHEDLISERYSTLHVFSVSDGPHIPQGITRRLPRNAKDPEIAQKWLRECSKNHEKCNFGPTTLSDHRRPTRLIHVGSQDGSEFPRLVEGHGCKGDYLTLSYCWGDESTITKTTKASFAQYQESIPISSISRIFQDAIQFTRSLSVDYIWIDALCIIQDSPEDKARELPRMDEIYASSLLALSASGSTSGDSTLFTSRQLHNQVEVLEQMDNFKDGDSIPLIITNHLVFDFSHDVPNGNLGSRGWCFQERLLAPRILHFGQDQLHWECHEGIWSESNKERQWYDDFSSADDGSLRVALHSSTIFHDFATVRTHKLGENATEEANKEWDDFVSTFETVSLDQKSISKDEIAGKKEMYNNWYKTVSAYTYRHLTNGADKLPALAGAAVRFNSFINDTYVAGLWGGDLVRGLLWSRRAGQAVEVDPDLVHRPGVGGWGETYGGETKGWRGAPSWSWASVDGPVHWMHDLDGPVLISRHMLMTKPEGNESYGGLEWCAIRAKGHLLELEKVSWLREEANDPEKWSEFERSLAMDPGLVKPQIDPDDLKWEAALEKQGARGPLYFFLVSGIPDDPTWREQEGNHLPPCSFGHALMLRYWPREGVCRRAGLAKVALRDFLPAEQREIYIL